MRRARMLVSLLAVGRAAKMLMSAMLLTIYGCAHSRPVSDLTAAQAEARADDADYSKASREGTMESYSAYLAAHPNGEHASTAKASTAEKKAEHEKMQAEQLAWETAVKVNTIEGYQSYVTSHPGSDHDPEATRRWAQLMIASSWKQTALTNTPTAYQEYLALLDRVRTQDAQLGAYQREEATKRMAALEEPSWKVALQGGNPEAMNAFVRAYPKSPHVAEAGVHLARALAIRYTEEATRHRAVGDAPLVVPKPSLVKNAIAMGDQSVLVYGEKVGYAPDGRFDLRPWSKRSRRRRHHSSSCDTTVRNSQRPKE